MRTAEEASQLHNFHVILFSLPAIEGKEWGIEEKAYIIEIRFSSEKIERK
jgi:hypothetical protein